MNPPAAPANAPAIASQGRVPIIPSIHHPKKKQPTVVNAIVKPSVV
jgi:hypothetical protein